MDPVIHVSILIVVSYKEQVEKLQRKKIPRIRVSGKSGANSTNKPPKPHPMSANSGGPLKPGKCKDQYMPLGDTGYCREWSENGFA